MVSLRGPGCWQGPGLARSTPSGADHRAADMACYQAHRDDSEWLQIHSQSSWSCQLSFISRITSSPASFELYIWGIGQDIKINCRESLTLGEATTMNIPRRRGQYVQQMGCFLYKYRGSSVGRGVTMCGTALIHSHRSIQHIVSVVLWDWRRFVEEIATAS